MSEQTLNLLQRINEARKEITYIQKDKSVSTGGGSYMAVTHDNVTGLVRPAMIKHGIVSWPSLVESAMTQPHQIEGEKVNKQWRYEATYDFTFANIDDGADFLIIRIQSHAMDNADKAPGKALSYAKKYALLKLFEIETGEDEESRYGGLDDDDLTASLVKINEAQDMATLKTIFAEAYKAATEAKDKDAAKALNKAKDARKAALMAGTP